MRSIYDFIITPKKSRYNNTKKVGDKELILNTEIFNHQYVSREAIVKHIPLVTKTEIQPGDEVIVHHNVFRRWHNIKGIEKNSRSYINEDTYAVKEDQIFAYRRNTLKNTNTCGGNILTHIDGEWKATKGYCFVKPLKEKNPLNVDLEKPLQGIVKYSDGSTKVGDLVGFRPSSEYEFIIDRERLYRVLSNFITIKYEYQGDEKEYNPSWTQSG